MNSTLFFTGQTIASGKVSKAIKDGKLADLKKVQVLCVDCGKRAMCYDHRDYCKPLEVEPVCQGCNIRRGSAKYEPTEEVALRNPTVVVKIDRKSHEILSKYSKEHGHSITWLMNRAIEKYLQGEQ